MFTRNLLDQPFFSGMKIERSKDNEAEENSGVSTELSLFILNHNLEDNKRKLECNQVSTDLTLSCSPTIKKLKAAESKYDYPNSSVTSATRNPLDSLGKPFFLGIKTEGFGDYEDKENTRVSTELRLVDETKGINDSRVSAELKLFDETWVTSNGTSQVVVVLEPWKVKKKLTASDVNDVQVRLLVPSRLVKADILPLIGATEEQIDNGIDVRVWDCDTSTLHNMKFQRWKSNSYVLKGKWVQEFVKRRNLKEKETIGLCWNVSESRFHFSVLETVAA